MKGKNGFWRKLRVLTLALAVTAMVPATSFAKDHVFKWRMANLYPRGSAFEAVYSGYCETIEKMSAGRLIIEDIYDGEGVPAPEVFGAVKSGLIEMGAPYMALHAGELPQVSWSLDFPAALPITMKSAPSSTNPTGKRFSMMPTPATGSKGLRNGPRAQRLC